MGKYIFILLDGFYVNRKVSMSRCTTKKSQWTVNWFVGQSDDIFYVVMEFGNQSFDTFCVMLEYSLKVGVSRPANSVRLSPT